MNENINQNDVIQEKGTDPEQQVSAAAATVVQRVQVKREYSPVEFIGAWLCFLAGYLLCRVGTGAAHPLGGMLFVMGLFAGTALLLWKNGACFGLPSAIIAASAVVSAVSIILSANSFLQFFSWGYCIVAYILFVYTATGNSIKGGLSNYIAGDLIRAMFVLPFSAVGHVFGAAFSGRKGKTNSAGKILLGLALAIIPTAVVLALLSYDADFNRLMSRIFDFSFLDVLSHFMSVIWGIPVAMYLFGAFLGGSEKRCAGVMTAEKCDSAALKARIAPVATVLSATLPLLAVYVIFFISQWKYYVSGFVGVLPDDISYANYAREGFFQLFAVAVINMVIVAAISCLMKRGTKISSVLLKILSIVFSVFTLVLISTAIAKMVMYINCYGLTHKRVYASWFMVLLAMIFIVIIVKQFVKKLKTVIFATVLSVLMFTSLAVSDVDSVIASYNVNRYLNGSLSTVDVGAMLELGDSAVPHMVHLAEKLSEENGADISSVNPFNSKHDQLYNQVVAYLHLQELERDERILTLTVPRIKAHKALDSLELEPSNAYDSKYNYEKLIEGTYGEY